MNIFAAESIGTTFYRYELDDVIEETQVSNPILYYLFEVYGWDSIDFEKGLFGSGVIGGDLYICETDGIPIEIGGVEFDPEEIINTIAQGELDIEDISEYIADGDDISQYVSNYELSDDWDVDDAALFLLQKNYSFMQIYDSLSYNAVI